MPDARQAQASSAPKRTSGANLTANPPGATSPCYPSGGVQSHARLIQLHLDAAAPPDSTSNVQAWSHLWPRHGHGEDGQASTRHTRGAVKAGVQHHDTMHACDEDGRNAGADSRRLAVSVHSCRRCSAGVPSSLALQHATHARDACQPPIMPVFVTALRRTPGEGRPGFIATVATCRLFLACCSAALPPLGQASKLVAWTKTRPRQLRQLWPRRLGARS